MKKLTTDEFQSLQKNFEFTNGSIKPFYDRSQNKTLYLGSTDYLVFKCQNCGTYHSFKNKDEYCNNCNCRNYFTFDMSDSNEYGIFCQQCNHGFTSWNCESCNSSNPIEGTYYKLAKKGGGCFIATAIYGSNLANEVLILKEFRDDFLLNYKTGKAFVKLYYWISPPFADQVSKHNLLKKIVKSILIIPLIKIANNLKRKGK